MAKTCPECGQPVDESIEECPRCGHDYGADEEE